MSEPVKKVNKKLNFTKEQSEFICDYQIAMLKELEEYFLHNKKNYEEMAKNVALGAIESSGNDKREKEETAKRYLEVSRAFEASQKYLVIVGDKRKFFDDFMKL